MHNEGKAKLNMSQLEKDTLLKQLDTLKSVESRSKKKLAGLQNQIND